MSYNSLKSFDQQGDTDNEEDSDPDDDFFLPCSSQAKKKSLSLKSALSNTRQVICVCPPFKYV